MTTATVRGKQARYRGECKHAADAEVREHERSLPSAGLCSPTEARQPEMSRWKVALSMASNVCCVVGVVAVNKHVQIYHGFGASTPKLSASGTECCRQEHARSASASTTRCTR